MAIQRTKSVKVNYLNIVFSGLIILALSTYSVLQILHQVYGRFENHEIMPTEENLKKVFFSKTQTVAVLHSNYTEKMLPENSKWFSSTVEIWKNIIEDSGRECDIIRDSAIENGLHFKYKTIVLPSAKAMSNKEIVQLKRFIENGGSVFATSGTASFTEDGKWRGWRFLTEIFGLHFTKEISPEIQYAAQRVKGGLSLTTGIPAGYSFRISTWDRPISCQAVEKRITQIGFWQTVETDDVSFSGELDESAGIVSGNYGKGKFIWMGFEIDAITGVDQDYVVFGKFFKNSLNWLFNVPTMLLDIWPAPYSSAAVITPFLTSDNPNIKETLKIIETDSIPVTFFIDEAFSLEAPSLVASLEDYGDIAAIVDLGSITSEEERQVLLYDYNTQLTNLKRTKNVIEKIIKGKIKGAAPIYGSYDQNSVHALINADFQYIFTDSIRKWTMPDVEIKGKDVVVSLPISVRDDYQIIDKYGLNKKDFQLDTYKDDINAIHFLSGLYVLRLHPEYQLQPQNVGVLSEIVEYIRDKNIWLTTPEEIKNWWRSQKVLEIAYTVRSSRRIAVEFSNSGQNEINNCIARINFNKLVTNIVLSSDQIGAKIPEYEFDNESFQLIVYLRGMKGGETLSLFIDFDNINI